METLGGTHTKRETPFSKKLVQINSSTGLNDTHISCAQEHEPMDLFSSIDSLQKKTFSILNVKNGHSGILFIVQSYLLSESTLNRTPVFLDCSLNPSFPLLDS
jgi:hypothetical protein